MTINSLLAHRYMKQLKVIFFFIAIISIMSLDTYDSKSMHQLTIQYQPNTDCYLIKFYSTNNQIVYCKSIDHLQLGREEQCKALVTIQRENYTGSPDDFTLSCVKVLERKYLEVKSKTGRESQLGDAIVAKTTMKETKQDTNELMGSVWLITKIASRSLAQSSVRPTLYFSHTKLIGTNICNSYSMGYAKNGESLTLSALNCSKNTCGAEENKLEETYTANLVKIKHYKVMSGNQLVFFDKLYMPIIFAEKSN